MSITPVLRVAGDDALARRAARGDDEAFACLVRRYHPKLELFCRAILRHDEDARDAAQSAMAKAFVALRRLERDDAIRGWLFRIAHNEAMTILRRRRLHAELPDTVVASAAGPADDVMVREELRAVLQDIRELAPRARQALLLRELGELDYAAVGRVLGISPGGARQAVFEARSALQDERAGRDEQCAEIRRELSARDDRRRPTRKARGHLRACSSCRTWSRAQSRRRRVLALGPGVGPLWGWLAGLAGGGASTGGVVSGGFALNSKVVAAVAVIAAGAAPVAVKDAAHPRRHAPARATTAQAPSAAAPRAVRAAAQPAARTAPAAPAVTPAAAQRVPDTAAPRAARRRAADHGVGAPAYVRVHGIDAGRAHAHEHLARARPWLRHIFEAQDLRPAELVNSDRFHPLLLYSPLNACA